MSSRILDNEALTQSIVDVEAQTLIRDVADSEDSIISSYETYYLAIVRPTQVPVPARSTIQVGGISLLKDFRPNRFVALDLETRGTDPLSPEAEIICVGMTADTGQTIVLDTRLFTSPSDMEELLHFLATPDLEFIGHNIMFDGAWLSQWMGGIYINWKYDTLAMYRHLANEGYPIQKYGLKDAQVDLLGWPEAGDVDLNEWLVRNRYIKGPVSESATAEELLEKYKFGRIRPDKAKMYLAPPEILGYYCGLDTYSTMKLFQEVFIPATERHAWGEAYWEYHDTFILNVFALIEQYLDGIKIDKEKLSAYHKVLAGHIIEAKDKFLGHEKIKSHVEWFERKKLAEFKATEPAKFKKVKPAGEEPPKFKKDGTLSRNWEQWVAKKEREDNPEISKQWLNWQARFAFFKTSDIFNLNSAANLRWLMYERLKMPVRVTTEAEQAAVGKTAIQGWGEVGGLLKKYNDLNKEYGMIEGCFAVLKGDRLHPQFRAPGTLTGRLAGGASEAEDGEAKFNLQQIPKKKEYLSCWVPDPGFVFVDVDVTALEPVVLTALSKDESMMKIYGPNAKPNDVYLFVGSNLPGLGEKIRSYGYDPDNPTVDAIAKVKKECKKERGIAKTIYLGCGYGMGPGKLQMTLSLAGIEVTFEEALELWRGYWNIFPGVVAYKKLLEQEYYNNQGWILNAIGRPLCFSEMRIKDILNSCIQSSGHDIQMMIIEETLKLRTQVDFPIRGIVWDFHDQSIVQVPKERAEDMVALYKEAYKNMNIRLKKINPAFTLDIKGDPAIVSNLAEAKVQE